MLGGEGVLTLNIKMRVSPEPKSCQELISLMRGKEALNQAIEVVMSFKSCAEIKIDGKEVCVKCYPAQPIFCSFGGGEFEAFDWRRKGL
jgi:hypothetical protein